VRPQELQMAQSLIDTLSGDFQPEQYSDNYREALQALIDAKVQGKEVVQPEQPAADTGKVVDLMAALRASVEAAREGRTGDASTAGSTTSKKSSAKKTAKSAAAKKSAAKPAAKKTAARSSKTAGKPSGKKTTAKRANARKSA
jgi:DNA end-binding protein Ku